MALGEVSVALGGGLVLPESGLSSKSGLSSLESGLFRFGLDGGVAEESGGSETL